MTTTEKEHPHNHTHEHREHASDVPSRELPRDKRTGREIAFGIQQTLACWATDFIDPYISQWYQNKYGVKEHEVTAKHTWGGEVIGDSSAFFVYMGIKRLFTAPVDAAIALTKKVCDPLLTKVGNKSLKGWARERHISTDDPAYQAKLDSYKEFQAENLVDTGIIAASSTVINVGAQRALGNKQGLGLILVSKLIGAVATMGSMLGLRTALPNATKALDDELSERYFSKVVRGVQKVFGVSENKHEAKPAITADVSPVAEEGGKPEKRYMPHARHASYAHQVMTEKPLLAAQREMV